MTRYQDPQPNTPSSSTSDADKSYGLYPLGTVNSSAASIEYDNGTDFVFIHGLGGHYRRTWTYPGDSNAFCWPEELANSISGSRVFSYGYPSHTGASLSVAGIPEFAASLLAWLRLKLCDDVSAAKEGPLHVP